MENTKKYLAQGVQSQQVVEPKYHPRELRALKLCSWPPGNTASPCQWRIGCLLPGVRDISPLSFLYSPWALGMN